MTKKDFWLSLAIGAGVGIFIQPVLTNTNAVGYIHTFLPVPLGLVRPLIFFFFLALAPFALGVAAYLSKFLNFVFQVAKFAAVGSLNSFIDLGVFNLLGMLFGLPEGGSLKFAALKTIGFLSGTTNSYFWNKAWTFGDAGRSGAQKVVIFYAITGLNWLVNVGVATLVSGLPPVFVTSEVWVNLVSPIVGIFCGMVGNFLGYKFIVFRKSPGQANI
jgi:putative flippase GtrA